MMFAPGREWISKRLRERLFRPGSGEPHLGAPSSKGEWKIFHLKISAEYRPVAPKTHRTSSKTHLGTSCAPRKKNEKYRT